jgi:type I restriction enzyme S subunit
VIGGGTAIAVGKPATPTPAGFEWTALSEVARLETGHTPSRRHPEYWGGDVPWIGIKDATANHGRTIYSTVQTVTEAGIANSSARMLPAGTVCLSRTASVGYVVVMGVPMSTSQDFVNWVCGPELDHRYLKYVLQLERDTLLRFASGTTHQTIYFPEAKAFHALLPRIDEQRAIADVLGALDDKIECNRKRSHTCLLLAKLTIDEAAAATGMPCQLEQLAVFHNRRRVPLSEKERLEMPGRIPYYGATGVFGFVDRALFDERLLLVGEDGSVVNDDGTPVTQYVWGPCWVNNHAHVLTGDGISTELLYLLVRSADARPLITGAVQPKLNMGNLRSLPLVLPPANLLGEVEEEIGPLMSVVRQAADETVVLTDLRDVLLPELLSGRLRVPGAEKLVEAAT